MYTLPALRRGVTLYDISSSEQAWISDLLGKSPFDANASNAQRFLKEMRF